MDNCKANNQTNLLSVGIDVAMDTLMVCEHYGDRNKIKEIQNNETSIKNFANRLRKIDYSGKIIMESTGRHHMLSAIILSENKLDARVINPLLYVASLAALIFSNEYSQSAKQWIAFMGLDVSVRQSAKWRGKGHLTKRGNNYLRQRLYSAAWGAVRHNEKFKKYYEYLKNNNNRKHREALVIIARKIIGIMFSLNKNNVMYDPDKALFVAS